MYLFLIALALCGAYGALFFFFPLFFRGAASPLNRRALHSVAYIAVAVSLIFVVSLSVPDRELGNRILHAFGGGFLSFMICFLAVRDSGLKITRFQFFVFSLFIVTFLGVTNEITEFFLQNYLGFHFADTINDTWLDLLSNTVGALIASVCFVPFIKSSRS